ncbi:MAG TPA: ATP-binding protein [Bacteroidales bacterium]|nr:ATP-binding protein [Bacteroidales bacterium]
MKKKFIQFAKWSLCISTLVILSVIWYYNNGSNGPIPLILVAAFSLLMYMFVGWQRWIVLTLYILVLAVHFLIEWYFPGRIKPYPDEKTRLIDFYSSAAMYVMLMSLIMIYIKNINQQQKEKADRANELKTKFLSNMSHEIRTPMNGIIGFAQMLKKTGLTEEKRERYVNAILTSSKQLLNIVNDILDISKIESGMISLSLRPVNIKKVIFNVIANNELLAVQKGLQLLYNIENYKENELFLADEQKLGQVLNNLVNNALKFTSNGSITIHCWVLEKELKFCVEDTGSGIEEKYQGAIFDRFQQVMNGNKENVGGTGLGLAICKNFVTIMGGKIWLESVPEMGSKFFFTIEKKIPEESSTTKNNEKDIKRVDNLKFKSTSILVVEDDVNNYNLLKEILAERGVTTFWAQNGKAAIKMVEENPHIKLVLMDIKLPDMTGVQALFQVLKIRPLLKVIATTAYAFEEEKKELMSVGFADYVSKPIKVELLFKALNDSLS